MKNIGMEVRSEVVSIAIVMQLRRMVAIISPLNTLVYRRNMIYTVSDRICYPFDIIAGLH